MTEWKWTGLGFCKQCSQLESTLTPGFCSVACHDASETYIVSGCNISAICYQGDGMIWIIKRIIYKGGVPVVLRIDKKAA